MRFSALAVCDVIMMRYEWAPYPTRYSGYLKRVTDTTCIPINYLRKKDNFSACVVWYAECGVKCASGPSCRTVDGIKYVLILTIL